MWHKSSYSRAGSCVEVALLGHETIAVRDTKDRAGPVLHFHPDAWSDFLDDIRAGRAARGDKH